MRLIRSHWRDTLTSPPNAELWPFWELAPYLVVKCHKNIESVACLWRFSVMQVILTQKAWVEATGLVLAILKMFLPSSKGLLQLWKVLESPSYLSTSSVVLINIFCWKINTLLVAGTISLLVVKFLGLPNTFQNWRTLLDKRSWSSRSQGRVQLP